MSEDLERRVAALEQRTKGIDEKVDEMLSLLRASKLGAELIKWMAGVGAAVAVIWGAFHVGVK